jgi:hypothetical protein
MATPIKKDPPEDEGLDILQALANIYNWKENVAENINPRSYGFFRDPDAPGRDDPILGNEAVQRLYNAIVLDRKEPYREEQEESIEELYDSSDPDYSSLSGFGGFGMSNAAVEAERQDLLSLMLGQGQKYGSIEPAIYKPTDATDPDAEYVRSKVTEEQIKKELTSAYVPGYLRAFDYGSGISTSRGYKADEDGNYIGDGKDLPDLLLEKDPYGDVLGNFTLDKGVDEKGHYISYYDKWDVNPLSSTSSQGDATSIMSRELDNIIQSAVGIKPREVYGRVYYDPETGKPIDEKKNGGTIKPLRKYRVLK